MSTAKKKVYLKLGVFEELWAERKICGSNSSLLPFHYDSLIYLLRVELLFPKKGLSIASLTLLFTTGTDGSLTCALPSV